jgi:cobalt-zinc-cadmium efflux system membrane fusion protein
VPNSALIVEGLYTYLFVEIEPGTFEKRRIELVVQDRQWSYIGGNLREGERIVSTGPLLLATEIKSAK